MTSRAEDIVRFFVVNFPDMTALAVAGPVALAWAAVCLFLSGLLKARWKLKTGYSRICFHFLIFGSVVVVN